MLAKVHGPPTGQAESRPNMSLYGCRSVTAGSLCYFPSWSSAEALRKSRSSWHHLRPLKRRCSVSGSRWVQFQITRCHSGCSGEYLQLSPWQLFEINSGTLSGADTVALWSLTGTAYLGIIPMRHVRNAPNYTAHETAFSRPL